MVSRYSATPFDGGMEGTYTSWTSHASFWRHGSLFQACPCCHSSYGGETFQAADIFACDQSEWFCACISLHYLRKFFFQNPLNVSSLQTGLGLPSEVVVVTLGYNLWTCLWSRTLDLINCWMTGVWWYWKRYYASTTSSLYLLTTSKGRRRSHVAVHAGMFVRLAVGWNEWCQMSVRK